MPACPAGHCDEAVCAFLADFEKLLIGNREFSFSGGPMADPIAAQSCSA
jgi:hypothetical protein